MKLFFRYLKTKRVPIAAFILFAVLFSVSFLLYRIPVFAALYPTMLCALLGIALLLIGFFRAKKTHDCMERLISSLCEDTPPAAETIGEEDRDRMIAALREEIGQIKANDFTRFRDMVDYYTVWAHQIKTPISSMKLTLQNEDSELSRRLSCDLLRTQQYVEMVLTFLRLDSDSGDYVFRKLELDPVIRGAVRKLAPEFIGRRLSLNYEAVGISAVTDEKWLAFVLEQLLTNALKYTRTGGITITAENEATLCISDTGIGIAAEDLPRIFEKGYTGYNGRTDKEATGLGLYLCRRVCNNLGIGITIESAPDVGTTVRLDFSEQKRAEE